MTDPGDLAVSLTTTRHILLSNLPEEISAAEFPVCIAEMGLVMFGAELEHMEHIAAESCKGMARTVIVDPSARTVFVGMDIAVEETGLVVYREERPDNVPANDFFKAWQTHNSMIFEFQVLGQDGKARFSIRGLWLRDAWKFLDIMPNSCFTVVS